MRKPRFPEPRKGFTLLEISVVMALLAVFFLVLGLTLVGAFQTEALSSQISLRQAVQEALADQFRQDVALATAAPDEWDEWSAGSSCLILRLTDTRHVVYRWDEGELQRSEGGGPTPLLRPMPLGSGHLSVEFLRSSGASPLLTLRITETRRGVAQAPIDFVAALGGDLR